MAKDNIYDIISSELILRLAASTAATGAPYITLTSSLATSVPAGFSGNGTFTSTVSNLPIGYTILANSHIVTTPTTPQTTTGSLDVLDTTSHAVAIVSAGSTYVANTTVTLSHPTDPLQADIVLTGSFTILAVLPIHYGVKAYSATPTSAGLADEAMDSTSFSMVNSILGRLVVALPTALDALVSITGPNGSIQLIADDFSIINDGGYNWYQLNYDTQLTGANVKIFTLNFQ